jgi:uncharacterized membrane protein YbhN (UPF0104 family)
MVGAFISIASLAFVGFAIYRSVGNLTENVTSARFFACMAAASFIYACLVQLIGLAWHQMLSALDHPSISFRTALGIFNRSNVYKYLPGNVFHMVGRYALTKTAGASHSSLAFSQMSEVALLAASSMIVAFVFSQGILMRTLSRFGIADSLGWIWFSLLVVAGAIVVAICVRFGIVKLGRETVFTALRVVAIYLVFFFGSGLLAVLLTSSIYQADTATLLSVIGIAAGAWLLGFVVPGAPGGLGVREAVMIGGFTAIGVPLADATAVAVGHRVATVIGDAIPALIEFAIRTKSHASE